MRLPCKAGELPCKVALANASHSVARVSPQQDTPRVIQFSTEPLTGCISGVIKHFDPREGSPGKAFPHTSQNAWMELLRWYHRHVR
jgi:hypothetical protein